MDAYDATRGLYRECRRHSVVLSGLALRAHDASTGPTAATFFVDSRGQATRMDGAALIATLRLLLLDAGFPVGYVAKFDRTDN